MLRTIQMAALPSTGLLCLLSAARRHGSANQVTA